MRKENNFEFLRTRNSLFYVAEIFFILVSGDYPAYSAQYKLA